MAAAFKEIQIEESEIKDLLAISERVSQVHQNLGVLRERQMRYEGILVHLRKSEKEWEADVVKKYNLGENKDWRVDPQKGVILIPEVKETAEAVEAPACENCSGDCDCHKED